jgi:hypothetical protein
MHAHPKGLMHILMVYFRICMHACMHVPNGLMRIIDARLWDAHA